MKKIAIFLNISIIFLLIYGIWFNLNWSKNEEKKKIEMKREKKEISLEKDTDGDGLEDWKENLYKTDPNNKDTDKDGLSDFEEVKNGWDPLVAGKGNLENKIKEIQAKRDFFLSLEEQKKEFQKLRLEIKENKKNNFKNYSFKIGQNKIIDKVKIDLKNNVNNVAEIILFYDKTDYKEIQKIQDNLLKKSSQKINKQKVQKNIQNLRKISNILKSKKVSNNLLENYVLGLSNGFGKLADGIEEILNLEEKSEKDKDKILEALKKYSEGASDIVKFRGKIFLLIEEYEIEFQPNEAGSYFDYRI